jgi:hypothetical protein
MKIMLVAIRKWQLAVRKKASKIIFTQTMDKLKLTSTIFVQNFHTKKHGKYIFKKKQLFCLSHEKDARKHVDEINARLQEIVEPVEATNFPAPHSVPLQYKPITLPRHSHLLTLSIDTHGSTLLKFFYKFIFCLN